MDFNWPPTAIHWLTKSSGWSTKTWTGILLCMCLLSFGCNSEPERVGADSKTSEPSAGVDSSDSVSADKKTAGVDSDKPAPNPPPSQPKPVEPDVNDAQFHAAIEAAAKEYLQFAIVNTSSAEAPTAKPEPSAAAEFTMEEPAARMSQAKSGHGQKLYFLFAKDSAHYLNPDDSDSPVGQVLVTESWSAVPGNADARNLRSHASGNRVNPRVTVDGETLKLGKRKDLFVMLKADPKNKATDDGWVYGVITPKSYEIKSAGAVASCIACHEGENDRLFRDGVIDWNARAKKLSAEASAEPEKNADPKASE